jgi:hypothetical protein
MLAPSASIGGRQFAGDRTLRLNDGFLTDPLERRTKACFP